MLAAVISALHILALGIGLGAVYARGRGLRRKDLDAILFADNWWGIAALLWIGTGLWRAFGGLEKGTSFYISNPVFHLKMGIFGIVGLLEMWPMVTFMRWRSAMGRDEAPDLSPCPTFYRVNTIQLACLALIPFAAAMMARGIRF